MPGSFGRQSACFRFALPVYVPLAPLATRVQVEARLREAGEQKALKHVMEQNTEVMTSPTQLLGLSREDPTPLDSKPCLRALNTIREPLGSKKGVPALFSS